MVVVVVCVNRYEGVLSSSELYLLLKYVWRLFGERIAYADWEMLWPSWWELNLQSNLCKCSFAIQTIYSSSCNQQYGWGAIVSAQTQNWKHAHRFFPLNFFKSIQGQNYLLKNFLSGSTRLIAFLLFIATHRRLPNAMPLPAMTKLSQILNWLAAAYSSSSRTNCTL